MGEQVASTIIYAFVAVAAVLAVADILYRRRD
jgi:peptidoglycan/LPS O-acetylase OafA/YrhL